MPRPAKPKPREKKPAGAQVVPTRLSASVREELLDELNREDEAAEIKTQISESIEFAIGMHPCWKEELDDRPRPAARAAELKPLSENCRRVVRQLRDLSKDAHNDILLDAANFKDLKRLCRFQNDAARMLRAVNAAHKRLRENESRHGKTHRALKAVVDHLANLFDLYYKPYGGEDPKSLSDQKLQFISDALRGGKIGTLSVTSIKRHLDSPPIFT
ncbi:MAG: hypothetical protein OEY86_07125 [Nitrospira sp.]|nr:hypothetical protein [Nitrospira sp.]